MRTEGFEPPSDGLEPTMLPLHHVLIQLDVRAEIWKQSSSCKEAFSIRTAHTKC